MNRNQEVEWLVRPNADYSADIIQDLNHEFPFKDGVRVIRRDVYDHLLIRYARAIRFLENATWNCEAEDTHIPVGEVDQIIRFLKEVQVYV